LKQIFGLSTNSKKATKKKHNFVDGVVHSSRGSELQC